MMTIIITNNTGIKILDHFSIPFSTPALTIQIVNPMNTANTGSTDIVFAVYSLNTNVCCVTWLQA
jgi:hypothetical protein